MHAAPARREVVAELVDEDQHAEHDDERDGEAAAVSARRGTRTDPLRGMSCSTQAGGRARGTDTHGGGAARGRRARSPPRACRPAACPSRRSTCVNRGGDIEKADPPLQEGRHRDLVGGIQDGGRAAAGLQAPRAPAAAPGSASRSGGSKSSRPSAARSSRGAGGGDALRPGQRMGDRHAHVRASRAAPARCRRGSRPCRGSPIAGAPAPSICARRQVEQPRRLDHLQPLVHHRRASRW